MNNSKRKESQSTYTGQLLYTYHLSLQLIPPNMNLPNFLTAATVVLALITLVSRLLHSSTSTLVNQFLVMSMMSQNLFIYPPCFNSRDGNAEIYHMRYADCDRKIIARFTLELTVPHDFSGCILVLSLITALQTHPELG